MASEVMLEYRGSSLSRDFRSQGEGQRKFSGRRITARAGKRQEVET
jgi:hypothetical protein